MTPINDLEELAVRWEKMLGTQFTPTETALVHETIAALRARAKAQSPSKGEVL